MKRKFFKIILLSLTLLVTIGLLIGYQHPILFKWILESARFVGKPIEASVYLNGEIVDSIRVFKVEKQSSNYLLLDFGKAKNHEGRNMLCAHRTGRYIGTPVGSSKKDYDYINGYLFQSETGGFFVPYEVSPKRDTVFNTEFKETDGQITFKIPHEKEWSFSDSVRINLKEK